MSRAKIFPALTLLVMLLPFWLSARVMMVVSGRGSQSDEIVAAFKQSYSGITEEYNLMGLEDEARKLGKSIVEKRPDLLIVVGNLAAKAAKEYCSDCAVVYAAADHVRGLKLSGSKISGVSVHPSSAKVIENLKLALPGLQQIGILYHPTYAGKEIAELQAAAKKAGLSLTALPVTQIKEIPRALTQLLPKIDAYLMLDDPGVVTSDTFPFIFMTCFSKKIPIFATSYDLISKGALAGYAPDAASYGSELANLSNEALNRKPAGKEKPAPAKLFLNAKIASMWNFNFPQAARNQAVLMQ
jgi:ABC-type uncharacterized transport system substrate-binding protein